MFYINENPVISYFEPNMSIKVKLLKLDSLPGETSKIICNYLYNFKNNKIEGKVIAFCADNAKINFGGVARKLGNNVFSKMKNLLNRNLIGVGCYITNNPIQSVADLLPIDVENIIQKIYGHFYIYTIRVNNLRVL